MEKFPWKEENEHKRKKCDDDDDDKGEEEDDLLTLSLSLNRSVKPKQKTPQSRNDVNNSPLMVPYTASTYVKPKPLDVNIGTPLVPSPSDSNGDSPTQEKSETIPPPFPWATDLRASIHSLKHLVQNKILNITGTVQCKRCERRFEMEFNLDEKFTELWMFIQKNKDTMHDRAPRAWVDPVLPKCQYCGQENSVKPVEAKKQQINWLFLLLGQMIGCCTLGQLKYFCKHTKNHRTGAKDRLLYSTYMGLCQQLVPEWFV